MTIKKLYATATGCSNIISITVSENHGAATAAASIICGTTSLDIGDSVSISLGYDGDSGGVFSGYVKETVQDIPGSTYTVVCQDAMSKAVDNFIASSDPDHPLEWTNISAEALVSNVFALAGLGCSADTTYFTLGINGTKATVNLVTSYDYCKTLADLVAFAVWCEGGTAQFKSRMPFYNGGSTIGTITDTNILTCSYRKTEKDLRNRIVVYGGAGIHAEASASSSYLPAGFYKTVVYSHPMIGSNAVAQMVADYNLSKLNKLTYSANVLTLGDHSYRAHRDMTASSSYFPAGGYYIYSCEHNWSQSGYMCTLDLRK